jgi:hypothetical protein
MKKLFIAVILSVLVASALSSVAFAAQGGMPAAHGVDGRTFGAVVSGLAQSDPGALAAHVSGGRAGGNAGGMGMPAAHGVDGQTFGWLVSQLAQMYPGAVADHVKP